MGIGDAIMTTADVRRAYAEHHVPVRVVGRSDRTVRSEIFDHNPKVTTDARAPRVVNGPGLRPYIAGRTDTRWTWRRMRSQEPGEIFLTDAERAFAVPYAGRVLVEPNVKANGHMNKAWAFDRWQELVNRSEWWPMIQVGDAGTRWLDGVQRVVTPTFRMACAVIAASRAFVGTEGALHHAAAAFEVPAVVLWSEFISPDVTGYQTQCNIRHAGDPCGWRLPCKSCAASMAAIEVDEVSSALVRMLSHG